MADVIPLKRRAKLKAGSRETPIVLAILSAAARLPWCNLWRNNTGALPDANGRLVTYGLAKGSADLVGLVECLIIRPAATIAGRDAWHTGRFVAIEVKRPGEEPTEDQLRFLAVVRARGGFATWVDSVEGATAALDRARDPRVRE